MSLVGPAALFVAIVVTYFVRAALAERRRLRFLLSDQPFRCRALLAVGDQPLRRGRLLLARDAGGESRWHARRNRTVVDLRGARVLSATVRPGGPGIRADDVLLRLRLGTGVHAWMALHEVNSAVVIRWLSDAAAAGSGSAPAEDVPLLPAYPLVPRRRLVPGILLGVAGLWLAVWAYLLASGDTVLATVVGANGDGGCAVVWFDGAVEHTSTVRCTDQPPGAARSVRVLAWPLRTQAVDPAWTGGAVLVFGLVPAAIGGGMWYARRRSRPLPAAVVSPAGQPGRRPEPAGEDLPAGPPGRPREPSGEDLPAGPPGRPPEPAGEDLPQDVLAGAGEQAATVLARLAPYAERQRPPDGWQDPRRPRGSGTRSTPWQVLRRLRLPLLGLAVVALVGVPWPYRLGGAVPLLAWAAWGLVAVTAGNRAVRQALFGRRRPALALLTANPAGRPVLLVCDPVLVPVRLLAVPLRPPLPHGAAAAFPADAALELTALGRLAAGEAVVAELPGPAARRLVPIAPAAEADRGMLGVLLDSAGALARNVEEDDDRG